MRTNLNLHNALNHCRIARHQGKISAEVQQRTLRRLLRAQDIDMEVITLNRWGKLMALRTSIARELAPKIAKIQQARWEVFHFKEDAPMGQPESEATPMLAA